MHRAFALTGLLAFASACGGDASCEKVIDNMAKISGESPSDEEKKEMVAKCKEAGWPEKTRKCLVGAKDQSAAMDCFRADEAFNRYMAKSKATEAKQFVKKIYDGARTYYLDAPMGGGLTPAEPQLPGPSVGPTPPLGTCCKQDDGKCMPEAALWNHPVWIALQFSVDDPHYYSYQYEVSDDGTELTARAIGDLDCDGEYATFLMTGAIDPSLGDGPVGSGVVLEVDPTE